MESSMTDGTDNVVRKVIDVEDIRQKDAEGRLHITSVQRRETDLLYLFEQEYPTKDLSIYKAEELISGIGLYKALHDGKVFFRVCESNYVKFINAPSVDKLKGKKSKILLGYARAYVDETFEKAFWLANYCDVNKIEVETKLAVPLVCNLNYVVGLCYQHGETEGKAEGIRWGIRSINSYMQYIIVDIVLRNAAIATLELLNGHGDINQFLKRLNDDETNRLFEGVKEKCDIRKAMEMQTATMEMQTATMEMQTATMERNTEAVNGLKEQIQAYAHFQKTGVVLSLTDAAQLFFEEYYKEIRAFSKRKNPDELYPISVNEKNTVNLRNAFDRWAKGKGMEQQTVCSSRNERPLNGYDIADYYEMLTEHLDEELKRHFKDKQTFDSVVERIKAKHNDR